MLRETERRYKDKNMKSRAIYHLDIDTMPQQALKKVVLCSALVILAVVSVCITALKPQIWYLTVPVSLGFLLSFRMKTKVTEEVPHLIALYAVDWALLLLLSFFINQSILILLNITILASFYCVMPTMRLKIAATVFFYVTYFLMLTNMFRDFSAVAVANIFTSFILYWFFFLFVNLCAVYVGKTRMEKKNLEESRAREEKLRQAYLELENVTILKERNRIAKDIHDNVGHAISTIIMQTEAAKMSFSSDPEKARRCIVAANLMAVNALEQMRASVHLLGDSPETLDLAEELGKIVRDTSEGSDVVIRAEIDPEVSKLDYRLSLLFRSALKEGLNNGIRHGKASAFLFRLKKTDEGSADFFLSDNGEGAENFQPGFGLSGIVTQFGAYGYGTEFFTEKGEGFEMHIFKKQTADIGDKDGADRPAESAAMPSEAGNAPQRSVPTSRKTAGGKSQ